MPMRGDGNNARVVGGSRGAPGGARRSEAGAALGAGAMGALFDSITDPPEVAPPGASASGGGFHGGLADLLRKGAAIVDDEDGPLQPASIGADAQPNAGTATATATVTSGSAEAAAAEAAAPAAPSSMPGPSGTLDSSEAAAAAAASQAAAAAAAAAAASQEKAKARAKRSAKEGGDDVDKGLVAAGLDAPAVRSPPCVAAARLSLIHI